MPYARALDVLDTELVLDSGDYARLLDKTLERSALQLEPGGATESAVAAMQPSRSVLAGGADGPWLLRTCRLRSA